MAKKKAEQVPTGGTYYRVDGKIWLVYTIRGGTDKVKATIVYKGIDPDNVILNGLADGGDMSRSQFNQRTGAYVDGGTPDELYEIGGRDMEKWFKEEILKGSGYNRAALENDEVWDIFVESLLWNWEPGELVAHLENTKWYQTRANQTRKWDNMTDVQRQVEIEGFGGDLQNVYQQVFGEWKAFDSPWLTRLSTQVAQGKITYESAVNRLRMAGKESGKGVEEKQRRADIAQSMLDLEQQARRWGVRMNERQLRNWATGIVDGKKGRDVASFMGHLKGQAEIRYGSFQKGNSDRDKGTVTADWADPYSESMRQILEVGTGDGDDVIFDQRMQSALRNNLDIKEFQDKLRDSDEWKETANYRDLTRNTMGQLSRLMGFG